MTAGFYHLRISYWSKFYGHKLYGHKLYGLERTGTSNYCIEPMTYIIYFYAASSCLSIAGTNAALALLVLLFLADSWKRKKWEGPANDFYLFAAVYGWKGVTLAANGAILKIYRVRELWDKLPYWIVARCKIEKNSLKKTFHVLFVTNSIVVVYAILEKFAGFPFIYQSLFMHVEQTRMVGYFGSPMHYGGYISLVFILCLALTVFYNTRFYLYLPFLLGGLILSGTRSYYIGVILAVLMLTYRKSVRALCYTAIIIPALLIVAFLSFPGFADRATSIFSSESYEIRAAYWPISWRMFKENPLFGIGFEEYTDKVRQMDDAGSIDNPSHAHNIYLNELAEGGVIGFLLIVFTMGYFIWKYYKNAGNGEDKLFSGMNIALSASFLNLMVAGFFEYNFGAAVIWLFITFIMGLAESYRINILKLPGST